MTSEGNLSAHKQGTVFNYKIILRKKCLTKNGYFNLEKINGLRIIDNGFLKSLRKKYNLRQKDLSLLASVSLRTEIGWEAYEKSIPFTKLLKVFNKLKISEKEKYGLIEGCRFTWGNHHGKNRIELPLRPENFLIAKYLSTITPNKVYLFKNTPSDLRNKFVSHFSIDEYYLNKTGLVVIYSYLLNKFLNTFYEYKKELNLAFPLSREIPEWFKNKVNLTKAVIVPLLITDGGEKPACVFCSGESDIVNKIWSDAWYYEFNLLPSSYKVPYKGIFVTSHKPSSELLGEIKKFSPSFKTSPVDETSEEYYRLPQPDLSYLLNCSLFEQQIAIRLFAITEGSISIHLDKRRGLITPRLRIACAHPKLIGQLRNIMEINNIPMLKMKGYTTWSNLSGLQTTSICSVINFLKIGGFIRGVNVAKSRSPSFGGFDKQDVLLGILEFMKLQREDPGYRDLNIQKINKYVKDIILNKQFRNEQYYIKYFGEKC